MSFRPKVPERDFMSEAVHLEAEQRPFEVSIEAFTGPVDLLCLLVESKQIDVSRISLTDIVRAYGQYLTRRADVPLPQVADFFHKAATLLLYKVLALFPVSVADIGGNEPEDDSVFLDDVERRMELFVPFRVAREILILRKERQERCLMRPAMDAGPVHYDIGDVYGLASLWWDIAQRRRNSGSRTHEIEESWIGVPDPVPEERLIETKVEELTDIVLREGEFSVSSLLKGSIPFGVLLVTLLALLEMCRMGRIRIHQEEVFGDIVAYGCSDSFPGSQNS
jgi:segregation and condensation protein A